MTAEIIETKASGVVVCAKLRLLGGQSFSPYGNPDQTAVASFLETMET